MTVTFYAFNKRENSTAQPTADGTDISFTYKNITDLDNPTLVLSTDVSAYNYAKIGSTYYFVAGRRIIHNGLWEVDLTIDALATEKTAIKNSTQYVLRSTVSPNYKLIDTAYTTEAQPDIRESALTMGLSKTGSYVLTTISGNGIEYWGLTESQLLSFLNGIMATKQEDLWDVISNIGQTLGPSMLKVTDYIVGCRWMPFPVASGGATNDIYLGYWNTHVQAAQYSSRLNFVPSSTYSLPVYPETDATKVFMNCSQFHSLSVFVPGCGEVAIDYAKLEGGSSITVDPCVDVLGNVTGCIKNGSGNIIGRFYGTLGADVPVSASNIGLGGLLSIGSGAGAIIGGIATIASGGATAAAEGLGAMGAGAVEIGSGALASIPDVNTKGGVGSYLIADGNDNIRCLEARYILTDLAPTQAGYPCMKNLTLSSNGYYLVEHAQVPFGGDAYIRDKIKSYMETGFYIE